MYCQSHSTDYTCNMGAPPQQISSCMYKQVHVVIVTWDQETVVLLILPIRANQQRLISEYTILVELLLILEIDKYCKIFLHIQLLCQDTEQLKKTRSHRL